MAGKLAAAAIDDERLVAELYRLGVRHLARLRMDAPADHLAPAQLIGGLASHSQARLQAALILLFLRQPQLSCEVPALLLQLAGPAAIALKLYYQAAVYLQRELEPTLRTRFTNWLALPDFFSAILGLPPAALIRAEPHSADEALTALGELHRLLTGWDYTWAGSYRQHLRLFLRRPG